MAWNVEKTEAGQDLVWSGVETGIAPSPTTGTANIQNANIATELGEILASYNRVVQFNASTQASITNGTLTASVSDGTTLLATSSPIKAGFWINISSSTIVRTDLPVQYLVVAGGGGGGGSGGANNVSGAGGGAGGVQVGVATVAVGTYAVTVGAGGAGGTGAGPNDGGDGSDSVIATIATATGGGGGGDSGGTNGHNGGSGGGGGSNGSGGGTGGTGSQGSNRGAATSDNGSGGGGGYSAVGGTGSSNGGAGGAGYTTSFRGTPETFAAGGGGGYGGNGGGQGGAGGSGIGGAGATDDGAGTSAAANTGAGGGGAASGGAATAHDGGAGGSGIVIIRYPTGQMTATGGTITTSGEYTIHTFTSNGTFEVTSATLSGNYYVSFQNGSNKIKISKYYDPLGTDPVVHGTTGTATFSTVAPLSITSPIAKATEKYFDSNSVEYRYYMLDSASYVWVYDTGAVKAGAAAGGVGPVWMLPDPTNYGSNPFTGFGIIGGWLHLFSQNLIYVKPTNKLGWASQTMSGASMMSHDNGTDTTIHFGYAGHQGKLYYTDNNYLGEIFPTTSLATGNANVQSSSEWTAENSTEIDIEVVMSGSLPISAAGVGGRMPVVFYTEQGGLLPPTIEANTVYWLNVSDFSNALFQVFAASSGGSAIVMTGSSGTQYFNTYYPIGDAGYNGSDPLMTFTNQRLNLPAFETATCMVEVGNTVLIGGITSTLYPWNQIDATPSDLIALPEAGVKSMINVNNMAYVFAGNKGNVYISNNSVASLVLKVPDYCAGVPGTPLTYIEPTFTWGDSMFLRGRVYFSILDQTSTKAGNCGGVWSFIPTQNIAAGQDTGVSLRLENQNSYADYDGYATVLLPNAQQDGTSPQFWTGWQDSYSTGTSVFGIDYTGTVPVTTFVFETDLAPTGTLLTQQSFKQLEYKLTTPLAAGDSVQLYWRLNSTDAWTSAGTVIVETTNPVSGYFIANFQKTQWAQFRAVCTTAGTTASSFVRLKELRLR